MDVNDACEIAMKGDQPQRWPSLAIMKSKKGSKFWTYLDHFVLNEQISVAIERREEYCPVESRLTIDVDLCLAISDHDTLSDPYAVIPQRDVETRSSRIAKMTTYDEVLCGNILKSSNEVQEVCPSKEKITNLGSNGSSKRHVGTQISRMSNADRAILDVIVDPNLCEHRVSLSLYNKNVFRNEIFIPTGCIDPHYEGIVDNSNYAGDRQATTGPTCITPLRIYEVDHISNLSFPEVIDKKVNHQNSERSPPTESMSFVDSDENYDRYKHLKEKETSKYPQYFLPSERFNEESYDERQSEASTDLGSNSLDDSVDRYLKEALILEKEHPNLTSNNFYNSKCNDSEGSFSNNGNVYRKPPTEDRLPFYVKDESPQFLNVCQENLILEVTLTATSDIFRWGPSESESTIGNVTKENESSLKVKRKSSSKRTTANIHEQDEFVPVSYRKSQIELIDRVNPQLNPKAANVQLITSDNYTDFIEIERSIKEESINVDRKDNGSSNGGSTGSLIILNCPSKNEEEGIQKIPLGIDSRNDSYGNADSLNHNSTNDVLCTFVESCTSIAEQYPKNNIFSEKRVDDYNKTRTFSTNISTDNVSSIDHDDSFEFLKKQSNEEPIDRPKNDGSIEISMSTSEWSSSQPEIEINVSHSKEKNHKFPKAKDFRASVESTSQIFERFLEERERKKSLEFLDFGLTTSFNLPKKFNNTNVLRHGDSIEDIEELLFHEDPGNKFMRKKRIDYLDHLFDEDNRSEDMSTDTMEENSKNSGHMKNGWAKNANDKSEDSDSCLSSSEESVDQIEVTHIKTPKTSNATDRTLNSESSSGTSTSGTSLTSSSDSLGSKKPLERLKEVKFIQAPRQTNYGKKNVSNHFNNCKNNLHSSSDEDFHSESRDTRGPKEANTLISLNKLNDIKEPMREHSSTSTSSHSSSSDEESEKMLSKRDQDLKIHLENQELHNHIKPTFHSRSSDCHSGSSYTSSEEGKRKKLKENVKDLNIDNFASKKQIEKLNGPSTSNVTSGERDKQPILIQRNKELSNGSTSYSSSSSNNSTSLNSFEEDNKIVNRNGINNERDYVDKIYTQIQNTENKIPEKIPIHSSLDQSFSDKEKPEATAKIGALLTNSIPIKERSKSLDRPSNLQTNSSINFNNEDGNLNTIESSGYAYTETWTTKHPSEIRMKKNRTQSFEQKKYEKRPNQFPVSRFIEPITKKPRPVPSYLSPVNAFPFISSDHEFGSNDSIVDNYSADYNPDETDSKVSNFGKGSNARRMLRSTPRKRILSESLHKHSDSLKLVDLNYGFEEEFHNKGQTKRTSLTSVISESSYLDKPILSQRISQPNLARLESFTSLTNTIPSSNSNKEENYSRSITSSGSYSMSTSDSSMTSEPESKRKDTQSQSNTPREQSHSNLDVDVVYAIKTKNLLLQNGHSTSEASDDSSSSEEGST